MEFRIRDLTELADTFSLEQVNTELAQHKFVLSKLTKQVFKKTIEHNIIILQMKRIELMKQAG